MGVSICGLGNMELLGVLDHHFNTHDIFLGCWPPPSSLAGTCAPLQVWYNQAVCGAGEAKRGQIVSLVKKLLNL